MKIKHFYDISLCIYAFMEHFYLAILSKFITDFAHCWQFALCLAVFQDLLDLFWDALQLIVLLADFSLVLFQFIIDVFQVEVVFLHLHCRRFLLFPYQVWQFLLVLLDVVFKFLIEWS